MTASVARAHTSCFNPNERGNAVQALDAGGLWPSGGGFALAQCGVASLVTYGPDETERRLAAVVVAGVGRRGDARAGHDDAARTRCSAGARDSSLADTDRCTSHSLVGTPVVQILGATDSIENAPWRETPSRTVRVPLPRIRAGAVAPRRRACAP